MTTEVKTGPVMKDLRQLAAPEKGRLAFSTILAVIGQSCSMVPFFLIYMIIAEVESNPLNEISHQFIYQLVFFAFISIIVKNACLGLSTCLSHISAYHILYDLRKRITDKLMRLPLGYFDKKNTGILKKIISEDVEHMEIFLAHSIPDFLSAVVYTILATAALFAVDWRLALPTVMVIPFGFTIQMMTMRQGREFITNWFATTEKMNAAIIEYIQGMPVIKAFNHTVASFTKYADSIETCAHLEKTVSRRWYLPTSVFSVSLTANMLLLLPAGAAMYLAGTVTPGKFVFFLLMGVGFGNPILTIVQFGRIMERNAVCIRRINAVLTARSLGEARIQKPPGRGIVGHAVEFAYNRGSSVIKGVDFAVPPQSFVALVGPSGAGKTTLGKLLPRYWDVDAGTISIGDTDVRDMKTSDLMDQFGVIFQNVYLFNDTVAGNIGMGKPDASEADVIKAAKTAGCHDFIMDLPEGYDTIIGERGARISGGEKQRLSIARALLKDSPILILDEATAFIDPENETLVQNAINRLVQNKTLIVIAHRLSTIITAKEIVVMDKGRISARGTHEALLTTSELYRNMWESHVSTLGWSLGR